MTGKQQPEPWLRGTLTEIPAVHRAVLHALQLAEEDLSKWCGGLSARQWNAQPGGAASVAFHLRHIARSLDRLLTYSEGHQLNDHQLSALKAEGDGDAKPEEILAELDAAFRGAERRIVAMVGTDLEDPREVGRRKSPTTLGGLLVHVADHTQRHVGQAITTAKIARSLNTDQPA